MRDRLKLNFLTRVAATCAVLAVSSGFAQTAPGPMSTAASSPSFSPRRAPVVEHTGDYIVAVVNNESVTANEVTQRIAKLRDEDAEKGGVQPTPGELRTQALNSLIEDRVLITYARDNGVRVDDQELDRAIDNIASTNKMSAAQLRERLRQQGVDFATFRGSIKEQIMIERLREREVVSHIKVSDAEIADYISKMRGGHAPAMQIDLAQILVSVPDKASPDVVAARQARAEQALARVNNGEPFEQVAREMSDDSNKSKGGEMGSRALDRYPDLFVHAVDGLKVGAVTPVVRSDAGFHILKVLSRGEESGLTITQTRVRHILLRPSAQLDADTAERRELEFRDEITSGAKTFEELARQYSEDGSAAQGGDLGWVSPGMLVPEFESAMDKLPIGGVSQPVRSRFGIHLIQVLDRRDSTLDPKQLREQAVNALKEQKFDPAYAEWVSDLRSKAFIEYRDPPV